MIQDWNKVYLEDVDEAYDTFLSITTALYEKSCPLAKKVVKQKAAEKPWLTKGILNEFKKKNLLYKDFLKKRTKQAEHKYKTYKNKLTRIMRSTKRDYYSNLLTTTVHGKY